MCVIIDANLASSVFAKNPNQDYEPVKDWFTNPQKDGVLVFGGHLGKELNRVGNARRLLRQLHSAGRAIQMPNGDVNTEESNVIDSRICRSDDAHVIALARISGARTLCSNDQNLHQDFGNPQLINNPRGSIYQNASHRHLLRHTSSCRRYRGSL